MGVIRLPEGSSSPLERLELEAIGCNSAPGQGFESFRDQEYDPGGGDCLHQAGVEPG